MPSSKFVNPPNFGTIPADTAFDVVMAINNLDAGHFVNAAENYFAGRSHKTKNFAVLTASSISAPQTVNAQGQIVGHTHVVIEPLQSLAQTTPTNPNGNFAFFKVKWILCTCSWKAKLSIVLQGINTAAVNGQVSTPVALGLPAGAYRICSINSSCVGLWRLLYSISLTLFFDYQL